MAEKLTLDDAGQLLDVANRNERVAATARRVAVSESADLSMMLVSLALLAEQAATTARALAAAIKARDDG